MKHKLTALFLSVTILCSIFFTISVSAQSSSISHHEPTFQNSGGGGGVDPNYISSLAEESNNYQYQLLKQTVALWADGRGDVILERKITNLDVVSGNSMTWYFDWYPGNYSDIRAWDNSGPLDFTTSQSGTRIYVTTYFRHPIKTYETYDFSIAITIANMAYGSANNWSASWYTSPSFPVQEFIMGVTFPSNSTFQYIYPTPNVQRLNYLEWRQANAPANWVHTIDIDYTLSNTINVPLLLQTSQPWEDDAYASYSDGKVNGIRRWGCNLTSVAMIINYWGQRNSPSFQTDPGTLNTWLKKNNGYNEGNGVVYQAVANYADENNISLYSLGKVDGRNDTLLDNYLSSGNPLVIGVDLTTDPETGIIYPNHWVVVTGKTTVGGQPTYSINDPIYGATTLSAQWGNNYSDIVQYSSTPADRRSITISAHSPIHLLVTDPLGRKSGFDPRTNTSWNEIPDAIYTIESISAQDGSSAALPQAKVLVINLAIDGTYNIDILGTDSGLYGVNVFASDWFGRISKKVYTGVAQNGSVDSEFVNFSSTLGVGIFTDIEYAYWAYEWIGRLYNAGITGGCSSSPLSYCPENSVTRAQMAIFLEKGVHYPSGFSPANINPTFTDTVAHWAEDWIEALRSDGITGGCGPNLYCPENPVTRAQMAVFLLKSKYGSSYTPPAIGSSTGFTDVPTTHWAAPWIKQLAAEGITGGCGAGIYCPESPVTRAQMAVFLVKTFNLP